MVAGDACCPRIFKARLMETRARVEERYPTFRMYFFKEEAPSVLRNTLRVARLKETLASCMWTLLISIQSVSTRNFRGRFAVPSDEGDNFYRVLLLSRSVTMNSTFRRCKMCEQFDLDTPVEPKSAGSLWWRTVPAVIVN